MIDENTLTKDMYQCGMVLKSNNDTVRMNITPVSNICDSYGNSLCHRIFKRELLEKAYEQLSVMENIYYNEDGILMKVVLNLQPNIGYIDTDIYQYNLHRSYAQNNKKYNFARSS